MDEPEEARRWLRWFVGLQVGVPAVALVVRWTTGELVFYGLGWEMFSS